MSRFWTFGWIILFAAALLSLLDDGARAKQQRISCGRSHRLSIVDLDMSPDPIAEGQRVKRWRVTIRVDGNGECNTIFEIRENPGRDVVGHEVKKLLRPGISEILFDASGRYRFHAREHCFEVLADIAGTRRPIDAAQRFCARETSKNGRRWTMKERGDRPVGR